MERPLRLEQLRPAFTPEAVGWRRLGAGLVAGAAFALTFYLAFLSIALAYIPVVEGVPVRHVEMMEDPMTRRPGREVPVMVGPTSVAVPEWVRPFWAGMSAALGQCVSAAIWLSGPLVGETQKMKRRRRYARAQVAMWVGLAPLVFVKIGELYLSVPYPDAVWASSFGRPPVDDPLGFLGMASALTVVFLALEPWRGLSLSYRCCWGPMVGVAGVLVAGSLLHGVGHWWVTV